MFSGFEKLTAITGRGDRAGLEFKEFKPGKHQRFGKILNVSN
jgi:hypothetical protein